MDRRKTRPSALRALASLALGAGVVVWASVADAQVTVTATQDDDCDGIPCAILPGNLPGYFVEADDVPGIYNVRVDGATPSLSYTSEDDMGDVNGIYLIIHQPLITTGPVSLDDVGSVANNGTITSSDASAVTIDRGGIAASNNAGVAVVINGELGKGGARRIEAVDDNNLGTDLRGLDLEGAFLVRNRGTIIGESGVVIDPDAPNPIPTFPGFPPFDFSFIDELDGISEIPNEIQNSGTIEGTVGAGIEITNVTLSDPEATLVNSTTGSVVKGQTDGFVIRGSGIVDNLGTIEGVGGSGVVIARPTAGYGSGFPQVTNRASGSTLGTIEGGVHAISIEGEGEIDNAGALLSSSGTVVEFLDAAAQPDIANVLTNSGVIEFGDVTAEPAAVSLGDGDDTLDNLTSSGSSITASIEPAAGILPVGVGTVVDTGTGSDTVTNSGQILAPDGWTALVLRGGDDVITNQATGTIDAPGASGVAISAGAGQDTITNAGTLAAPDGIAIDAGVGDDTVNLQTGSVVQGAVRGGADEDTLILDGNGTQTGDVSEFATLRVTGTGGSGPAGGDWQVDGDLDVGTLEVASGMLTVSEQVTVASGLGGAIRVRSGGVLAGNGTLLGPVSVFGILAPGRLVGTGATGTVALIDTLDIVGRTLLAEGSVLSIDFTETENDLLRITGNLDVESGSLVRFIAVDPDTTNDKPLSVFLEYTGNLTGTLEAEASAVFDFEIVGAADDPAINPGQFGFRFTRNDYVDLVSENHLSLATILDAGRNRPPTDELAAAYVEMDAFLTAEEVDDFHGQMSPEFLGFTPIVAFEGARNQFTTLTRHLREIRLEDRARRSRLGPDGWLEQAVVQPRSESWNPHVTMLGQFSNRQVRNNFDGFDAMGGGLGLGVDGLPTDSLITGFQLSAVYNQIQSRRYDHESQVVTPRIAGYVGYTWQDLYVDGIVDYGFHWVQSKRRVRGQVLDETAESSHFGHEFSAYLGAGYLYDWGKWNVGPSISFQYLALFEDDYAESGAGTLSLALDSEKTGFANSRLGLRTSRELQLDDDRLIAQLRFDWAREWQHERKTLDATLSGLGDRFSTQTSKFASDWFSAGVGLKAFLENSVVLEFDYELDVSIQGDLSHALSALWTVDF